MITALRCVVTPSRKSRGCIVCDCFDSEGNFLPSPLSQCEHPAGCLPRSCSAGLKLAWLLAQLHAGWRSKGLQEALLPPIKALKSAPAPWALCFGEDPCSEAAQKVASTREPAPQGSCDLGNDDSEGKAGAEEEEQSELNLALSQRDDIGSPSARAREGAEATAREAAARRSAARASRSDNDRARREHKACADEIRVASKRRLDDVGGPNENLESKLKQVEFLTRTRDAVDSGKLPSLLLSHCARCSRNALLRWQAQLQTLIRLKGAGDEPASVNWPPMHLEKAPLGSSALAGEGFASSRTPHPKLNEPLTPAFLRQRDQFDVEDLIRGAPLKKRRWGSEANFRRVDEARALQGRAPRQSFAHLHEALDWAHG